MNEYGEYEHMVSRINLFHQRKKSLEDRFWEKVDKTNGEDACWEWKGHKNLGGYGSFGITLDVSKYTQIPAHRFAYMITYDIPYLPRNVFVCHSCDNPPCCNPRHLWLGSNKSNQIDYFAKGLPNRHPTGKDNHMTKLTEEKVLEIRRLGNSGLSMQKIAKIFGVANSTIFYVLKRHTWKHLVE